MNLIDSYKISIAAVYSNKLRSSLTALGIIIGIASVIMMISLGQGAQALILGQISSMGSKTIFIEPGAFDPKKSGDFMSTATEEMSIDTLKYEDAVALRKLPSVAISGAMVYGAARAIYGSNDEKYTFLGITPEILKLFNVRVAEGRDIAASDVKAMEKVVIIGQTVKDRLFADRNPIGEKIKLKDVSLRVVGVMEPTGVKMMFNFDELLYLPLTTAQKLIIGGDSINMIAIEAKSESQIDQAVTDVRAILRDRHKIDNPENDLSKDDFKVMSQKETASMVSTVTSVLTIFLSLIAAIALLVGGIGIMNIMFVSVTERTREIGLRKAVGARNKDILIQFLMEAVILTIAGGLIGIFGGLAVSYLSTLALQQVASLKGWVFVVPYQTIAIAFGICVAIGIIFGIYPARAASLKNPIEALRYE